MVLKGFILLCILSRFLNVICFWMGFVFIERCSYVDKSKFYGLCDGLNFYCKIRY